MRPSRISGSSVTDFPCNRRLGAAGRAAGIAWAPIAVGSAAVEIAWNGDFSDDPLGLLLLLVLSGGVALAVAGRGSARGIWGLLPVFWLLLLAGLSFGERGEIPDLRLMVVGIDGATWTIAEPMIAEGELPNLARLRAEGASGRMIAQDPLFSPVLWTTLASGLPQSGHGIRGFRVRSDDCRAPRFFDVAAYSGLRIGLYQWLVTWPPREPVNGGFLVPGWLSTSPATLPADLSFAREIELSWRQSRPAGQDRSTAAILLSGLQGGLRMSTLREAAFLAIARPILSEDAWFVRAQLLRGRIHRDAATFAMNRHLPELSTFTYYPTDAISHRAWGTPAIQAAYREADAILGELLAFVPPEGRVVVLSDHGFRSQDSAHTRVGPRADGLREALAAEGARAGVERIGARLVITLEDPSDRARLDGILSSVSGEDGPLFRWEADPERAGVVLADLRSPTIPATRAEALSAWLRPLPDNRGDHDPDGIFVAWGPGVTPGARVDVGMLDVAPILLAGLDLPADVAMTGRVPEGLWPPKGEPRSWQAARDALIFPEAAGKTDEEMLRALGYTDTDVEVRTP